MLGLGLNIFTLAIRRYFGGGGGQFAGSSLNLDFTSGNQSLDPRITFSRASNATVTGPDGTLGYAPHNLLTFSEQFDATVWTQNSITLAANISVAPNGTTTAERITPNSSTASHHIRTAAFPTAAGLEYTFSIYAKADGYNFIQILATSGFANANFWANFDLSNGTVGAIGSGATASIEAVGNGWYRCRATGTAAGSGAPVFAALNANTASRDPLYAGDTTSAVLLWGAQLNIGPLQPYYPTTVKNLLGYTQEFDNAAWTKSNVTVAANATTAPDGSLTADKLVETIAAGNHLATQSFSALTGATYTGSVRVKAGERSQFRLVAFDGAAAFAAYFDLAAGTVGTTLGAITPSIQSLGGGWFVCSGTFTSTATSASGNMAVRTAVAGSDSYTGDGTSGIFIWGAQLSDSASLDPYVYNPEAAPTAQAYYGPRFDYDPVTLAPKGLLIEEQRTNLLLQSEAFDTASWTKTAATISANAIISPDGTQNADGIFETATTNEHNAFQGSIATTLNATYAMSVYVKAGGRTKVILRNSIYNGGNSNVGFDLQAVTVTRTPTGYTAAITSVGNGWYRCSFVTTATIAGTRYLSVALTNADPTSDNPPSYAGDGTSGLYLWGAQLEAGAFPTSYIPTTTAAATRAADVAVMTGANFSNWYRADEGSLFAEASSYAGGGATQRRLLVLDDGGTSNRMTLRYEPLMANAGFTSSVAGTLVANIQSGVALLANVPYKNAGTYKTDDYAFALGGSPIGADTSGAVPAVNAARLGQGSTGEHLNGHIRRLAFFPRRLTSSELEGITK